MNIKHAVLTLLCIAGTLVIAQESKDALPVFTLPVEPTQHAVEPVTANDIMLLIHPLLTARSVEKAIEIIKEANPSADVARDVVRRVLRSKNYQNELSTDDKIQFVLGIASIFKELPQDREGFFVYIQHISKTKDEAPLFFLAAKGNFSSLISSMIDWFMRTKGEKITETEKSKALLYAAKHGEHQVIKTLEEQGFTITPNLASMLLWEAITHEAPLSTVEFLLSKGANPSYHPKKVTNTTMLMEAIRHNKQPGFPITKALIAAKAKEGVQAVKAFVNEHSLIAKNDEVTPIEVAGNLSEPIGPAIIKYLVEQGAEE